MVRISGLPCTLIDLSDLCPVLLQSRVHRDTFVNAIDSEFRLDFFTPTAIGYCCGSQGVACPRNPSSNFFNRFIETRMVQEKERERNT